MPTGRPRRRQREKARWESRDLARGSGVERTIRAQSAREEAEAVGSSSLE